MSNALFRVGNLTHVSDTKSITPIFRSDQLESVQNGDLIAPLNDYLMEWDHRCLRPSELESWRYEGDDQCDEVVKLLSVSPGQDGLSVILNHLSLPISEQIPKVRAFWETISSAPPGPISAVSHANHPHVDLPKLHDPPINPFRPESALLHPDRLPEPCLSQGQAVFWRYSAEIFSALLHFSLAGGFSAVRVVNVLRETNYLTGEARDSSYKRLLETTQAILDYMNNLTPLTGIGWKSAVRVRILHSTVRVRLRERKGIKKEYDESADGIPINQEDLIATLGSFAIAPLWSLRRMGIRLTDEEESAYVAVWRHIGYYLGISPSRLETFYCGPDAVSKASKLFACNTMHLFPSTDTVEHPTMTSTYRLLSSVSMRPPRNTPVEYHVATSRLLLGDGLANRLGLPATSHSMLWRVKSSIWAEWALVAFGRVWRKGWEIERVAITRTLVSMIVCWQLGTKRTKFTIKKFSDSLSASAVEDRFYGAVQNATELEEAMRLDEDADELDPEVKMGPKAGQAIVKRWKWLIAEMVVVSVGIVGVSIGCLWFLYRNL